jgi:hypothetical protein
LNIGLAVKEVINIINKSKCILYRDASQKFLKLNINESINLDEKELWTTLNRILIIRNTENYLINENVQEKEKFKIYFEFIFLKE